MLQVVTDNHSSYVSAGMKLIKVGSHFIGLLVWHIALT